MVNLCRIRCTLPTITRTAHAHCGDRYQITHQRVWSSHFFDSILSDVTVLFWMVRRFFAPVQNTKKIPFAGKAISNSLSLCLFTDFSSTDFSCRPNDARHLSPHVNVNVMNVFQFSFGFFGGVLPLRPFYLHWHTMRFLFHSSLLCLLRFFFSVYATSFVLLFFVRFKNRHRHTATGHTLTHTVIYL